MVLALPSYYSTLVIKVKAQGMDYSHPNPEVHNELPPHNSKRKIKSVLSFSLFCVLLSLLPLLLQSLKPFLMQFFNYTVGKSYMFLLCNGLLVFIGMNSGLINASSPTTHESIEQVAVDSERSSQIEFNVSEIAAPIADESVMEIESPQEEEKSLVIVEQENVLSDTQEEEEEGNALAIIDEDEHEHGDIEELNKKCEDFIRKVKAGFRLCSEPRADESFYFDHQKAMVSVN